MARQHVISEDPYVFCRVSNKDRTGYDACIGNTSRDSFLADLEEASWDLMDAALFLFKVEGSNSAKIQLDTSIAEEFFSYAVEGVPAFLMVQTTDGYQELQENSGLLVDYDFGMHLSAYIAYNELFTSLEESYGGRKPAYSLYMVLNMFAARMKLDHAFLTGEECTLSIHEVAILAQMKERSVRNATSENSKDQLFTTKDADGRTTVPAGEALKWLSRRKNFTPSAYLQTNACRQLFIDIAEEHFV